MGYGQTELHSIMCKLIGGAQKWSNIQDVVAASAAFHKCITQLLGHIIVASSLVLYYKFEFKMDLLDIKGARTQSLLVSSDKPNKGLGFCLAPDGNQKYEYACRVEKIKHICKAAVSMHLRQYDIFILLTCRLIAQTTYIMQPSQLTEKQCHALHVLVLGVSLPLMKINLSTPRALVYGPLQYSRMDIVNHSILRDQVQDQWAYYYFTNTDMG